MKWEILKNEIIYGEIKGFPYIINPKTAYVHTHNWDEYERGHVNMTYKTKYGKWKMRHVDESFFRHDEIVVNGKTMDFLDFIKKVSCR